MPDKRASPERALRASRGTDHPEATTRAWLRPCRQTIWRSVGTSR